MAKAKTNKVGQYVLAGVGVLILGLIAFFAFSGTGAKTDGKDQEGADKGNDQDKGNEDKTNWSSVPRIPAETPVAQRLVSRPKISTVVGSGGGTVARNYGFHYNLCRLANADARLLGYTGADVRSHCAEYALEGGPIHIG